MRSSSRTLMGFGIGIGVLILTTIILVLTQGKGTADLLAENTPEGVVQRYLLAIQEENYQSAFSFLSPRDPKDIDNPVLTYEEWLMSVRNNSNNTWKASLGAVKITGDSATVDVIIDVFRPGGPFANPVNTNNETFVLKKTVSSWLIISPTYLYWLY